MRHLWVLLYGVGVLGGCASTQSPPPAPSTPPMIGQAAPSPTTAQPPQEVATAKPETAVNPTATLHVKGLGCPLCATNMKKALLEMSGVQKAVVDLGKGTATVTTAQGQMPSDAQFDRVVQDSGFTLEKVDRP